MDVYTFKDNIKLVKKCQINFQKQDRKSKISNKQLNVTLTDLQQLIKNIQSQKIKNSLKLTQIKQINRYFLHIPIVPTTQINFNKIGMRIAQQLLLKQLDNLLEEEHILQKQFDKCKLNFQFEVNNKLSFQVQQTQNHYSFLRNVWTKNKNNSFESQQKIQFLNMQVAVIKKNILQMLEAEKNSTDYNKHNQICFKNKNYKKIQTKIISIIQETQTYRTLKQKYQQKQMEKEEQNSIISQLLNQKEQNKKIIYEKDKIIEELSHQNKSLKSQLHILQAHICEAQKSIENLKSQLIKQNSSVKKGNYYYIKTDQKIIKENSINKNLNKFQNTKQQFIYQITNTQIQILEEKSFQSSKNISQLISFLKNKSLSQEKIYQNKYQNPQYIAHNTTNIKINQYFKKDINRVNSPHKYRRIQCEVGNHPKFIRMNVASPKIERQVDVTEMIKR